MPTIKLFTALVVIQVPSQADMPPVTTTTVENEIAMHLQSVPWIAAADVKVTEVTRIVSR
jgi:hypothetical protein